MKENIYEPMQLDLDEFAEHLKTFKKEVLESSTSDDAENDDALILEVIRVLEEELQVRKMNKKANIQSEARFMAYLHLFGDLTNPDDLDFSEEYIDDEEEV